MRKILTILFSFLAFVCVAQNTSTPTPPLPNWNYVGSPTYLTDTRGVHRVGYGFIHARYTDTATANANAYIKSYPGLVIVVGDTVYMRNATATQWLVTNGSGGGGGSGWALTGNTGLGTSNFIGTIDSVNLAFKAFDKNAGYISLTHQSSNAPYSHYRTWQSGITVFGAMAGDSAIKQVKSGSFGATEGLTAIGAGAAQSSAGDGNTAIGHGSQNRGTTARRNTSIGIASLMWNRTGRFNTMIGTFAGEVQEGVDETTAIGHESLRSNRSGIHNTGVGTYTLTFNSTWVDTVIITNGGTGYSSATITISAPDTASPGTTAVVQATASAIIDGGVITGITMTQKGRGYSATNPITATITGDGTGATATAILASGDNNTATGFQALYHNQRGSRNTANGAYAGMGSSGANFRSIYDTDMTFIGYNSRRGNKSNTLPFKNGTAIGANSIVSCDSCLILGDSSSVKVGIGTTVVDPKLKLDVRSTTQGSRFNPMTASQRLAISSPSNGSLVYDTDSSSYFQYASSAWQRLGGVGTPTDTPGIDSVLAQNQTISADRFIDMDERQIIWSAIDPGIDSIVQRHAPGRWETMWSNHTNRLSGLHISDNLVQLQSWNGVDNEGGRFSINGAIGGGGALYEDYGAVPTGIQYNADYSATYTNRSLVDKGYLDSRLSGIAPVLTNTHVAYSNGTTLVGSANFTWDSTNAKLLIGNGSNTTGILTVNGGNQSGTGGQVVVQQAGVTGLIFGTGSLGGYVRAANNKKLQLQTNGTGDIELTSASTNGIVYQATNAAGAHTFQTNAVSRFSVSNSGISLPAIGSKISIATGSNASIGTATLVAGTVTVNTTAVTSSSKIFLTVDTPGGTQGFLSAPTASIVNATSFVINSSSGSETSTVNWWIIN